MMGSWIAYASLVSAALSVGGLALERLASAQRWPLRWIWVGILIASSAWPIATIARPAEQQPAGPTRASSVIGIPFTITVGPTANLKSALAAPHEPVDGTVSLDRALVLLWLTLSGLLFVRVAYSVMKLRRRARSWRNDTVDGVAVRISVSDGPAVVNLYPMEIVLPEWILSLDVPRRALVLRHEQEHRATRDPYLLLGAALLLVLLPWNLALWFAARRLRLAIEIDCDARVLRAHPSPERYGLLILDVAQRQSTLRMLFATMLSESTTHLERRIIAMQTTHPIARRAKAAAAILAVSCVALASTLQPAAAQAAPKSFDAFMSSQGFKSWTTVRAVRGNSAPHYPDQLRANSTEGAVLTAFVVDTAGNVETSSVKILISTNDAFTSSVRAILPSMRFVAAEVDGRKVKQLVQVPFVFGVGDHAVLPVAVDTANRTTRCDQGTCPVYRLATVVTTIAR